jgi:hypothetical protein
LPALVARIDAGRSGWTLEPGRRAVVAFITLSAALDGLAVNAARTRRPRHSACICAINDGGTAANYAIASTASIVFTGV